MDEKKELTVEEKQELIFEILKDIDAFCRANDIKYSISDGTMLGAIRHGGFIPWDDDADICMLREDFDRFAATYKSDRYQLLYKSGGEDEYFYGGYIKINDPRTISGEAGKLNKFKYGVFVDIFPFEDVPEDETERNLYMHNIRRIDNRLYHSHKRDLLSLIKTRGKCPEEWWKKLDSAVHQQKYSGSPLVGQSICVKDDRVVLRKDMFDDIVDIPFQGYMLRGFRKHHEYLKFLFGEDYMTPKKWAHNFVVYMK